MREWKKQGKEMKCERCGCNDEEVLSIDHIIPITILYDFGLTDDEIFEDKYLQLYCYNCNIKKGIHLDFENPKTKELLLKLLEKI